MKRSLRAFISYRRADAFTHTPSGADTDFFNKLKDALTAAGFTEIFHDIDPVDGFHGGENFATRIYDEVQKCDLFIALVGRNWLTILDQKKLTPSEPDILVLEIGAAVKQEKVILPLLVDGADMPAATLLPGEIRQFHFASAVNIRSDESVEELAARLRGSAQTAAGMRRLRSNWKKGYIAFSVAAYLVCAVLTHIVGTLEYGLKPWLGMAKVWSGFFVWPIFFLPFTLLAIYRPLTVVLETATTCKHLQEAARYLSPVAVGTLLAVLAVVFEVGGKYETPWTLHPILPGCEQPGAPVASPQLAVLDYDKSGALRASYASPPFWLKDKCWPNVFFYLTIPAYQVNPDTAYVLERPGVQKAFIEVLLGDIKTPYSHLFYVYVASFTILIWLGTTGVLLAIFHVAVQIRRPLDNMLLQIPREDAYLCLTYAFLTLILWIPFRMNTVYSKDLYNCSQLPCTGDPVNYMHDIVLGTMMLLGYLYLTTGLLVKYRRVALCFLGSATVAVILLIAGAVVSFSAIVARMAEQWQFYLGISIPLITILAALWFQFDPMRVRREEFGKEIVS